MRLFVRCMQILVVFLYVNISFLLPMWIYISYINIDVNHLVSCMLLVRENWFQGDTIHLENILKHIVQ